MKSSFAAFQAIPERPVGPVPKGFPDDPRQLPQWIDALPLADAQSAQQILQEALAALPSRPWRGAARLQALEQLRPVLQRVLGQRFGQLQHAALPLPPAAVAMSRAIEGMHLAMAQGYRQAVAEWCAPSGSLPLLKSAKIAEALQHATCHYAQALAVAWRVYRAPLADVWQSLHRTFAYARAVNLDEKAFEDELAGHAGSTRQLYLQTLLVMLANPYALAQAEQDAWWKLARDCALTLPLRTQRPDGVAAALAPDVDAPMPLSDAAGAGLLWLDVEPLLGALRVAADAKDGGTVWAGYGTTRIAVERELAQRLVQTLSAGVARGHARLLGGHRVDTVLGLSAVHFHLAGGLPFDAFVRKARGQEIVMHDRAAWTQESSDVAWAQTLPAQVIDQSRTGYCLLWESEAQARIRVGELVAVSLHDEVIEPRAWLVGMIRWLRYEDDGNVTAGVELVALHARAVAIQALARTAAVADAVRAIEFIGINGHPAHGFIAATVAATLRPRQQIMRVDDDRILATDVAVAVTEMLDLQVVDTNGAYRMLAVASPGAQATGQTA